MNRSLVLPVVLAVLVAGLVGVGWLVLGSGRAGGDASRVTPATPAAPAGERAPDEPPAPAPSAPDAERDSTRTNLETAPPPTTERDEGSRSSEPLAIAVRARVLDVNGLPLAGVPVRSDDSEEVLARSDGAGAIEVPLGRGERDLVLEVAGVDWATVRSCRVRRAESELDHLIVAAPAVDVAGRVLDASGLGIEGALVSADLPRRLLSRFPYPLDHSRKPEQSTRTDASGAFRLPAIAVVPDAELRATHDRFEPAELPVPTVDRTDLFFELRTFAPEAERVRGRVFLPDGRPAANATVRYSGNETHTAADGSFALEHVAEIGPEVALVAGLEGYGSALIENFARVLDASAPRAPTGLELTLSKTSFTISGRVVDEAGQGRPGWWVGIRAGVSTSSRSIPPPWAEALTGTPETRSDESGSFELTGLFERDYSLWAYDPHTLQAVETEQPVPAGERDVRLVAASRELFARVGGVVLSRGGIPVSGVTVSVQRNTFETEFGSASVDGQSTRTDEDGRFTLERVPKEGVALKVSGSEVVPESVPLARTDDVDGLRLSVARRCHFKLELEGTGSAPVSFQMEDDAGSALLIFSFQSQGWSASTFGTIQEDGHSQVYAVSEDARTVALHGATGDVTRRPVTLLPDVVNEVRIDLPHRDD